MKTAKASRVGYMGRKAVLLANDEVQALVETVGGICYGTALVGLDEALVREGVTAIEAEQGALVLKGARASQRVPVSADFAAVRALCARLERR